MERYLQQLKMERINCIMIKTQIDISDRVAIDTENHREVLITI